MIKYEDIKSIDLELTERCQAECPMCPRTGNSLVGKRELSLANIENIFPKEFIKQLTSINMCGNFGEPVLAKDFIDIIQYFRFANRNIVLNIHSNAGARDEYFWKDLAYLLQDKGTVYFGIDGLEDTNNIYRKKVQWDKVISSAQAFIDAGGKARWEYIVFEHNEHQVEEARELSKKMGFFYFQLKNSARWDDDIRWNGFDSSILKPSKIYKSEDIDKFNSIDDKEKFYNSCSINCKTIKKKQIFLSAEGLLFPCCFTAVYMYIKNAEERKKFTNFVGNTDEFNAKFYSIKKILEEKHFEKYVESWDKPSIKEGKLFACSRSCNSFVDPFTAQFYVTKNESNVT
jgi:MoaA/NifB/PqqE/SkfB family radical SAM enzyme